MLLRLGIMEVVSYWAWKKTWLHNWDFTLNLWQGWERDWQRWEFKIWCLVRSQEINAFGLFESYEASWPNARWGGNRGAKAKDEFAKVKVQRVLWRSILRTYFIRDCGPEYDFGLVHFICDYSCY